MTELRGTQLAAAAVPFTDEDTFATHYAKYGNGGWQEVATTDARDAITTDRREAGMAVYVTGEGKLYILGSDLETWTVFETGKIDKIKVNGTEQAIVDKTVDITVPTKISDLTDDTATNPVDKADTLTNLTATVTELNYTDGVTSNIQTQLDSKQATLTAGTNITIEDNEISATDTTYSAGNGLTLSGTTFSANVQNNVTSTSTTDALSANMGKELNDRIDNLESIGKFLSGWNCATGLPTTDPTTEEYTYNTGDYFFISNVATGEGAVNYRPNGNKYTRGVASTTVETDEIAVGDIYLYDSTNWLLLKNTQKTVSFSQIAGQPTDNTNLAAALNAKVTANADITGATKTKITYDNKGLVTAGADLEASDIPNLTLSKITDVTATASEVNVLDGITATTTELNYVDGVTSSIQTQLNSKQATIDSSNKLSSDLVDDTAHTNKFVTASEKTTWSGKQDALTAGTNIDITNNTISATDTTYTAGTGLALSGTEFSVDTDTIQEKLTAGNNVTINNNVVSARDTTYLAGTNIEIANPSYIVEGYKALKYVESDGTGYINTGHKYLSTSVITMEAKGSYNYPVGDEGVLAGMAGQTTYDNSAWFIVSSNYQSGVSMAGVGYIWNSANEIEVLKIDIPQGKGYWNGNDVVNQNITPEDLDVYLFARNRNGTPDKYAKGRIRSYVQEDNGVKVLDLHACKRESDNAVGFYDLVSETFITCAGLTAGPDLYTDQYVINCTAEGSTYTAGTGIDITDDEISVDDNVFRNVGTGTESWIEHKCGNSQVLTKEGVTLVGNGAVSDDYGTVFGDLAGAGRSGVAVGFDAQSSNDASISIGQASVASGECSVALGYQAVSQDEGAIVIGKGANSRDTGGSGSTNGIAIGTSSKANANAVAIGYSASTLSNGVGIGPSSRGSSASVGIGYNAKTYPDYAVAIGNYAEAQNNASNGVAIGNHATSKSSYAVSMGYYAGNTTSGAYSVAVGNVANAAYQATAVGDGAVASGYGSVAIGHAAKTSVQDAIQLGQGTNNSSGTLKFKSYELVHNDGSICADRLADTTSAEEGQVLKIAGSGLEWGDVDGLPSQSGQSGKFLTTNGTTASWAEVTKPTYNATTKTIEF